MRTKGFTLKHESAKNLISKNLMMEFLESLAKNEQKQVGIPQLKFYIEKNSYQVAPKHYEKLY